MSQIKSKHAFALRSSSRFAICLLFVFYLLSCASAQDTPHESPQDELKHGKYQAAILAFTKALEVNPKDGKAQKGLLQAYLETGQYAEAEASAKKFLTLGGNEAQSSRASQARLTLGEVYATTGRYTEAIAEFEKASEIAKKADQNSASKPDDQSKENSDQALIWLRADLRRGEILQLTGATEPAKEIFQSLVKYYEDEDVKAAEALALVARALTHLERYQDANDVYLEALDADKGCIEAQLGGGELYTEKYNYQEAAEFLNDALKINPYSARGRLAVAENKRIDGGDEMNAALSQALRINPNYVEAKTFAAAIDLEAERFQSAGNLIDEALKINPNSLEAHSLRAAMFWLEDKQSEFNNEVKTTLGVNPRYGLIYETVAHFATQTRRYSESVEFLKQGLNLSPNQWSSHLALGMGLLRLGKMEEGRAEVEKSFEGDGFNIWAKNTLDLLDAMKEYRETKHGDFIIKADPKESDVLAPYAAELLDDAKAKLSAKYKFTPRAPIDVEMFPNHEDFAVRALGLPGLGALGVCFGQVIAQDSPLARAGQVNWGSTLWHEYTHVFTLQITDNLIPRWFSEGLSVFEEHNARPGWGDDWSVENIRAFTENRWFTIANLDNGFIRPKRPDDITLAYFQASQVCHFIDERFGFNAILDMLRGYKEKKKTPDILAQTLKLSETDFDREFNKYVHGKIDKYIKALEPGWKNKGYAETPKEEILSKAASSPDDFLLNLRAGAIYFAAGDQDKAVGPLKRSIELFPLQSGEGNAYETLAQIYEKRGDKAAAADALESLVKVDENNYEALKKLAQLKIDLGDKARALEFVKLSFYINPSGPSGIAAHTMAGDLLIERNENDAAIREFQVALAADPPNVAEAQYNLARAFYAAGKNKEARRAVLRSLEVAPAYDKAQQLLLKLTGQ
ncbi:MAG: tetratricopeptide repeat protein [Chloracidobacterium sp.]|nr:tetratricopeptide repeat protein [Chloracidobacterium sp.]